MTDIKSITIEKFLEFSRINPTIIIDLRDKEKFDLECIPDAFNIPIFNSEQKKAIESLVNRRYWGSSPSSLIRANEFIKSNVEIYISQIKNIIAQQTEPQKRIRLFSFKKEKKVFVYCWRGGAHSQRLATILKEHGLDVILLEEGYCGYTKNLNKHLHKTYSFKVIGGQIGSGKTAILHELQKAGEQILDLEKCAEHSGTIFGTLGKPKQRRNRNYMAAIGLQLSLLDSSRPIWVEEKTRNLGKCWMQNRRASIRVIKEDLSVEYKYLDENSFWKQIVNAPIYRLALPIKLRIKRIIAEYAQFSIDELHEKAIKIIKPLGRERYNSAMDYLESGNLNESVQIILKYYDSYYKRTVHERNIGKEIRIVLQEDSPEMTAKRLIDES